MIYQEHFKHKLFNKTWPDDSIKSQLNKLCRMEADRGIIDNDMSVMLQVQTVLRLNHNRKQHNLPAFTVTPVFKIPKITPYDLIILSASCLLFYSTLFSGCFKCVSTQIEYLIYKIILRVLTLGFNFTLNIINEIIH